MTLRTGVYRQLRQERVHFGHPAAEALLTEVDLRRAKRVFVATGRTLSRHTPVVREATALIADRVVGQFDECVEHTPRETVIAMAAAVRRAEADLIVSIGGGTVIDTVKVALVALAEGLTHEDELSQWHMRVNADGSRVVPQPGPPPCRQIAVPTTLSGAEFSDLGGCTDTKAGAKHGYTGEWIGPAAVVLDPRVTMHTPQRLWASTGIRAVDHAVESLCARNAQPLVDATSLRALALLIPALGRVADASDDLEARLDAQIGAWLAAASINRVDYGASHGLGHALGADAGVPHGITSCVLLPSVMRFNAQACAARLQEIAQALGASDVPAADQIEALIARLGLPTRIAQLGLPRERLAIIADKAMANPWVRSNPQPIDQAATALALLESAWS